ncbi:MAG: phenylacetate--CoA ligase family protein [Deltaproteobacteria bacterium]|nr:phenylacetate--CoA ligase family protein [Deltaproteobacteria bacterium]
MGRLSKAGLKRGVKAIAAVAPPQWRKSPLYWKWRLFLGRAENWSPAKIRAWQLKALQGTVRHAFEKTEGYRDLYRKAGVAPRDIRSLDDVRRLPFVTKRMIQENLEAFSVARLGRLYVTTGGSTGIPFGFYTTRGELAAEMAFMHSGWSRHGFRLGDACAVLRGAHIGSETEPMCYDRYARELNLSSYFLDARRLPLYLAGIRERRIRVMQAYPSAFNIFSDLVIDAGLAGEVALDLVLLGSENTYDWQLAKFKKAFPATRFCSWYGQAERVILAPWCRSERKYHVWPFYGLTEVLGPGDAEVPEGGEGELVGTGFHTGVTPLIRYRTMDIAVKGAARCAACGRQFQLLDRIEGRAHEFIVTRTGRHISMTAINMHDRIFDGLSEFQFVQERAGAVVFRFVPKREIAAAAIDAIRRGLMRKLGSDVDLTMTAVAEIGRTPSGKRRFLDQRLPVKYGDI